MNLWVLTALVFTLPVAADGPQGEAAKKELEKLQGNWALVSLEYGGKPLPPEEREEIRDSFLRRLEVRGDRFKLIGRHGYSFGGLKIDPTKTPRAVTITDPDQGKKAEQPAGGCCGLFAFPRKAAREEDGAGRVYYEQGGDTLKVLVAFGKESPTGFKTEPGSQSVLVVFRREMP